MDISEANSKKFDALSDEDQIAVLLRCTVPPTNDELKAAFEWLAEQTKDE